MAGEGQGDDQQRFVYAIEAAEFALWTSAPDQLPALQLAREVSVLLGSVIEGAHVPPAPEPVPPEYWPKAAILQLAIRAFRAARGAITMACIGYGPEAQGSHRVVREVHHHIEKIINDDSGQFAREWMDVSRGGPSSPRRLAAEFDGLSVWDTQSWAAHADVRFGFNWLSTPAPDVHPEHENIRVEPHRTPLDEPLLVAIAADLRDISAALAITRGGKISNLADLDARLTAEADRVLGRNESGASPSA